MAATKLVTPESSNFGRRLRAFAEKHGLRDEEAAAKALGVGVHGLRAIYKGQNAQQYMKLAEFARALGVTPNDLLGFQVDAKAPALDASVITTLTDLMAGMLIGEGWDEEAAVHAAEAALQFVQEPKPKVQNIRQWTRVVGAERLRRVRDGQ